MPDIGSNKCSSNSVWLCDLTYTQQTIASDTMPMAVAGIATYAEAQLDWLSEVRIFKYPEKLISSIHEYGAPKLIGFSNYVWNFKLGYEICRTIKELAPDTISVFGGPNYPTDVVEQEEFLRAHSAIDFYILKEGEQPFLALLNELYANQFAVDIVKQIGLDSIHSISTESAFMASGEFDRLLNLSEIPSPYLSNKLDEFFDGSLMPIIQTNRGCPFKCTFCVEGVKYYDKIGRNDGTKISKEIAYIASKMLTIKDRGGRSDLFIADSNFGMYKEDIETCRELASAREYFGWPEYIHVATGKNNKERVLAAAEILGGGLRLSGSVQSLTESVLDNIKRKNIAADDLMELALEAKNVNANSYSEIILGLPGETKESHFQTIKQVIEAGFNNVYLFQLMILPGSELASPQTIHQYGMTLKYRVLPRCYGSYEISSKIVTSAEIEAICVQTTTLSYEDYLECRLLHLIITVFYNDTFYSSLLTLIKSYGFSPWRWILILSKIKKGPNLNNLFDDFTKATKDELWDNKVDLENFINQTGMINKYLDGKLGNNLLFVYKSLALTNCLVDLTELARLATKKIFAENKAMDDTVDQFIDDASRYHFLRMNGIFNDKDEVIEETFWYDLPAFDNDPETAPLENYLVGKNGLGLSFQLDSEQKDLMFRYKKMYGDNPVGIGRILSKVYVKKLFRIPLYLKSRQYPGRKSYQSTKLHREIEITGLGN